VPFGATVADASGNVIGVVGQGGRVIARGLDEAGRLTVKWGEKSNDRCLVDYVLPKDADINGFTRVDAMCVSH
jgi:outer membrane usher protein